MSFWEYPTLPKEPSRRKIPVKEWLNLGWLSLFILTLAIYWFYNPFLLSELIGLVEKTISGETIILSETIVNFVLLFAWSSAFRFLALMIASIIEKKTPPIIENLVYTFISLVLGHTFNSWYHTNLLTFEVGSTLLSLFSLYTISKGIAKGWFHDNKQRILEGDWARVVAGIRVLILSLFFTQENFSIFQSFTVFLAEKFTLTLDPLSLLVSLLAFLEICLFIFLLTEFPIRLVFAKCKKCEMLFLKIGVRISSWDSEHTSKHRHCPRCGAACFL